MQRKIHVEPFGAAARERDTVEWKLVGEEFKSLRESKGVSLEKIAAEMRIGLRYLKALETGRWEALPGAFYQKAFVGAYARYLGIKEDRVRSFTRAVDDMQSQLAPAPTPAKDVLLSRRVPVTARTALILLASSALGALVLLRVADSGPPQPAGVAAAAARERLRPRRPAAEREVPFVRGEFRAAEESARASLEIVVKVEQSCWLELRSDGVLVAEGLFGAGEQKQIRARDEIRLTVGNAGGVSLWINGRPAKPLGRSGTVLKNVLITPENFMEFVAS